MTQLQLNLTDKLELLFSSDLCELLQDAWVLVYSHRKIILEKLNAVSSQVNQLTFNNISKLLVFSKDDELKVWVYQGQVKFRLWSEQFLEDLEEYEEKMLLWGSRIDGDRVIIEEGRGCRLVFPVDLSHYELPLHLKVKNYYAFDENGLIQFKDARLVQIADRKNEEVR